MNNLKKLVAETLKILGASVIREDNSFKAEYLTHDFVLEDPDGFKYTVKHIDIPDKGEPKIHAYRSELDGDDYKEIILGPDDFKNYKRAWGDLTWMHYSTKKLKVL